MKKDVIIIGAMSVAIFSQENKDLLIGYLDHSKERDSFKKQAACLLDSEGVAIDPWEYDRYRGYLQNCLEDLSKIYAVFTSVVKNFSLELLVNAHFIGQLDLGPLSERKITARKTTKEAAEKVEQGFESLSLKLDVAARMIKYSGKLDSSLPSELEKFSFQWDLFHKSLEKDRADVKNSRFYT